LVEERHNGRIITEAQFNRTAVHSLLSKQARTQFQKLVKSLNVKAKPIAGLFGEKDDQGSEQGSNQHSKGLWD